MSSLKYS